MPVFGGYETVRELYRSGLASAYTARKVGGDGPDHFVVKCYRPFVMDDQQGAAEKAVADFLDGARAQQKAAAAGGQSWAPVHEIGQVEGGGYFVTDNHHRSVQHLIRGRVKLAGGGLYRIVSGVVQGLIEMKRACDRPHGNLKPSNILLAGKSDLAHARVLLTDPAGPEHLDPQAGDVIDFHAVGALIYQLVLHRTGRAMGGWPAPEGKEWGRLGRNGEPWRQLCNRLLNPNLAPGLLTFDDLADDVGKLRERSRALPAKMLVPVAVLGLGVLAALVVPGLLSDGGGGGGGGGGFGPPEQEHWERLCNSWRWVRPLLGAYRTHKERIPAWEQDEHLRTVALKRLSTVSKNSTAYNPRWFANMSRYTYAEDCAAQPSGKAQSADGVRKTEEALKAIDSLRAALSKDGWPQCKALGDSAASFRQRTWDDRVASYLEGLTEFNEQDVLGYVAGALAAKRALPEIEGEWGKVHQLRGKLAAWGEGDAKPLAGIGTYVQQQVASIDGVSGDTPLAKLLAKLKDLHVPGSLLRSLEQFVDERSKPDARKLDWAYVKEDPPFPAMAEEDLRKGLQAFRDGKFDVLADPRKDPKWAATVDDFFQKEAPARLDALAALIAKPRSSGMLAVIEDQGVRGGFDQKLSAAEKTAEDLRTKLRDLRAFVDQAAGKPCSRQTIVEIHRDMTAVRTRQQELRDAIDGAQRSIAAIQVDMERYLQSSWANYVKALESRDQIRRPQGRKALAAIDSEWVNRRKELIEEARPNREVGELSRKVGALECFLQKLEADFDPNLPAGLTEQQRPWNEQLLANGLGRERAHRVEGTLSYVDWQKVYADQDANAENYPAEKAMQLKTYQAWRTGLGRLVADFNRVQDQLAAGYRLDEKPAADANSLQQLVGRNVGNVVWAGADANQGFQPTHARIVRLRQVRTRTDPAQIVPEVTRGKPREFEVAREAYLRLGGLGWPRNQAELREEAQVRKSLAAIYGQVTDPARQGELLTELSREGRTRWADYMTRQTQAADIQDAVARMKQDFGIDPNDATLPELARFRLAMHDLRQGVAAQPGRLGDAQVKGLVSAFLARTRALSAMASRGDLAPTLAELATVPAATGGGGVDLAKAGPAAVGNWQVTPQGADQVTYSGGGGQGTLVFRKVTPPGGKACFLSTTEVSLGLFRNVLRSSQRWKDVDGLLPLDEDALGPRAWVRGTDDLALADAWLHDLPPTLMGREYPDNKQPPKPADGDPMQHVSLGAAIYFCRLLNCRLPTSSEWLAAHEVNKGAAAQQRPNLRDETWRVQRDHLIGLEENESAQAGLFYPYVAIFLPKGMTPQTKREALPVASAGNDGILWFAKVDSDGQAAFKHLVGNAAEFTYEQPDALGALKSGAQTALAEVTGLVKSAARAEVRVLGASALSPPEEAPEKPQEVTAPRQGEELTQSFSDVGFRLAFFAGRERLQDRVLRLLAGLANQGYLTAQP
ncbi:MAG TPA: SUMF1/EgtB/PvdO family nonheme iron enzyme [Phycisphaerae bacterium]|nr:SUMF1/EgtB/PvdO family nonheme iron enzyme [Phycisphaerae bacterium]